MLSMSSIFVDMALISTAAGIIAEDRTTKNLRFLVTEKAGVRGCVRPRRVWGGAPQV